jgi:hypothetical protein
MKQAMKKGGFYMKRNRYILCLLAGAFLLYFAVPRFSIFEEGLGGIFSVSWLVLALLVIAGNLSALLYSPRLKKSKKMAISKAKRVRHFG